MVTATLTSKGQVTIPKEVRDALGLEAGSMVMFVRMGDGTYRMLPRNGRIQELAGILKPSGQSSLTVEQMNADIADAAAESGARGLDS